MRKYDAAVIGGGLSGLTSSIYLAKAGLSVVLLEKANQLGGRSVTVKKNGAMLNLGLHALYKGGAAEEVLNELGIPVKGGSCPQKAAWCGITSFTDYLEILLRFSHPNCYLLPPSWKSFNLWHDWQKSIQRLCRRSVFGNGRKRK